MAHPQRGIRPNHNNRFKTTFHGRPKRSSFCFGFPVFTIHSVRLGPRFRSLPSFRCFILNGSSSMFQATAGRAPRWSTGCCRRTRWRRGRRPSPSARRWSTPASSSVPPPTGVVSFLPSFTEFFFVCFCPVSRPRQAVPYADSYRVLPSFIRLSSLKCFALSNYRNFLPSFQTDFLVFSTLPSFTEFLQSVQGNVLPHLIVASFYLVFRPRFLFYPHYRVLPSFTS